MFVHPKRPQSHLSGSSRLSQNNSLLWGKNSRDNVSTRSTARSVTIHTNNFFMDNNRRANSSRQSKKRSTSISKIQTKDKQPINSKKQLTQDKAPIQFYFNPQFRINYSKKVIDQFLISGPTQNTFKQLKESSKEQFNSQLVKKPSTQRSIRNKINYKQKPQIYKRMSKVSNQNQNSFLEFSDNFNNEDQQDQAVSSFIRSSPFKQTLELSFQKEKSFSSISESKYFKQTCNDSIIVLSQLDMTSSQVNTPRGSNKDHKSFIQNNSPKRFLQSSAISSRRNISPGSQSIDYNDSSLTPYQKSRKLNGKIKIENLYFQEFLTDYQTMDKSSTVSMARKYLGQKNPLLLRELKISKRNQKMIWQPTPIQSYLLYPNSKAIRQQICERFQFGTNTYQAYTQIYKKPYYDILFENDNEELKNLITSMTEIIVKNQGKILTCAFNLDNVIRLDEKQYKLKDLGSSAILEQFFIREKVIRNLIPPYLIDQYTNQWLIKPQYLSPQVLKAVMTKEFDWIKYNPNVVISSEIWSLGCMILQLLTMIPLDSYKRCRLKFNPSIYRRGLLASNTPKKIDLEELIKKQKRLKTVLPRLFANQLNRLNIKPQILQILKKMLNFESSSRITPNEILKQMKKVKNQ